MTAIPPPTWTSFPAHAVPGTDWSDHTQAHRAVMRLFSPALPGPRRHRRAAAGILYRLDVQPDGGLLVLIQSQTPAELLPPQARALTLPPRRWEIPAGIRVTFRVAVNPVTRRTVKHEGSRRTEATATLPAAEMPAWLAQKLHGALILDTITNQARSATTSRRHDRHAAPPRVIVDTVDAIGTVTDPAQFARLRAEGIGRAKSYGCGLLTAIPAR